jgi:predicted NUDIX family NTP pyrophosphohydrolase
MDEFLRRRLIAEVATLLRHRGGHPWRFRLEGIWSVDPKLTGLAGRGFIANIDVAIAHD